MVFVLPPPEGTQRRHREIIIIIVSAPSQWQVVASIVGIISTFYEKTTFAQRRIGGRDAPPLPFLGCGPVMLTTVPNLVRIL